MTSQLFWILLLIQITMGAFDTIFHHELTERLAWRVSQAHELALHAVRNLLYAAVFIMIGWFETHGAWAFVLMAVLVVEVVITLADFVEEDLSRALPASERVNHTLLALNYGAILCILLPQLLQWSRDATALKPAFYGFWSILTAVSAVGVVISGLRDHFASRRAGRFIVVAAAVFLLPVYLFDHGLIAPDGRPVTAPALSRMLILGFELVVWGACFRYPSSSWARDSSRSPSSA